MSPGDLLRWVLEALGASVVRSRLVVLAVAVGVAAVMMLTALGESAKGYVVNQFAGVGANLVVVMPGKLETEGAPPMVRGGVRPLTIEDARHLRRLSSVVTTAPIAVGTLLAEVGGRSRMVTAIGGDRAFVELRDLEIAVGQNLPAGDPYRAPAVCLIGSEVRRQLFGAESPLGKTIRLGQNRFRVIGQIGSGGTRFHVNVDELVLVPVVRLMRLLDEPGLFRILVQARSAEEVESTQEAVREALARRHDDNEDFTLVTPRAILDSLAGILELLTLALTAIAGISLVVAGVLITNVMLVAVVERTPEIGLLKAIGASEGQVVALLLAEAATLSLAGTALGIALGMTGAWLVTVFVPALELVLPLWALQAAPAVALVCGIGFGALPAWRAARLAPVEALRARR